MDQPTSDKLQSEKETTQLAYDTLSFLQERVRVSSIQPEQLEYRRTAEFDLSCISMAFSSQYALFFEFISFALISRFIIIIICEIRAVASDSCCLSDKRKWLSNLDMANHILSKLYWQICERRGALHYEIESRSLREGFEKLPDEIISPIFVKTFRAFESHRNRIKFSLQISQVSHRFRRIALYTPELWSTISTSFPLSMVSTFLKRSRTCELDIEARNINTIEMLNYFLSTIIPSTYKGTVDGSRLQII